MKKFILAAAVALAIPSAGSAATVSQYSASALISVTLVSATYATSGADAYDALGLGYWQDGSDSYRDEYGTSSSSYIGDFDMLDQNVAAGMQFRYGYSLEGYASSDEPYGSSNGAGWITPVFTNRAYCDPCLTTDTIRLVFDYSVEESAETTVFDPVSGSASASSDAVLGFQNFLPPQQPTSIDYDLAVEDGSGRYSVNLLAGYKFGLDLYVRSVQGSAEYSSPPVVPLPASLPMLAAGLVGVGFMARRKRKSA